jgi:hypothetical protein
MSEALWRQFRASFRFSPAVGAAGLRFIAATVVFCACVGCADAPKSSQVTPDPILARKGGVLLLVDASIHEETLAGENYFVINEAEAGAEAAASALRNYIQVSDIPVRAEVITIGGARLTAKDTSISVADNVGGPLRQAPSSISCQTKQPLRVPESIRDDLQYVSALCIVSSYALERSGIHGSAATTISAEDFQKAAEVIQNRTEASSVLFLGVLGWSRSSGKRAAQFAASMAVWRSGGVRDCWLGCRLLSHLHPRAFNRWHDDGRRLG